MNIWLRWWSDRMGWNSLGTLKALYMDSATWQLDLLAIQRKFLGWGLNYSRQRGKLFLQALPSLATCSLVPILLRYFSAKFSSVLVLVKLNEPDVMAGDQLLPAVSASTTHPVWPVHHTSYRIRGDLAHVLQKSRETAADFQYTS